MLTLAFCVGMSITVNRDTSWHVRTKSAKKIIIILGWLVCLLTLLDSLSIDLNRQLVCQLNGQAVPLLFLLGSWWMLRLNHDIVINILMSKPDMTLKTMVTISIVIGTTKKSSKMGYHKNIDNTITNCHRPKQCCYMYCTKTTNEVQILLVQTQVRYKLTNYPKMRHPQS